MAAECVFAHIVKKVEVEGKEYQYFSLQDLNDPRIGKCWNIFISALGKRMSFVFVTLFVSLLVCVCLSIPLIR